MLALLLQFLVRYRWYAAGALGLLALYSLGQYELRLLQRHLLAGQQGRATAVHAAVQAQARTRYARYQLDSTARATERRGLLESIRTQSQANEALRRRRPALIDLPDDPPREQ